MSRLNDSLPSAPVRVFDTPEILSITPEFVYNFFTPDERVDEAGSPRLNGNIPEEFRRQGNVNFSRINAEFPRLVNLRFNYRDTTNIFDSSDNELSATKEQILDALSSGKVVTETNMSSKMYTAMTLGNQGFDAEINNVMCLALNPIFEKTPIGISPTDAVNQLSAKTNVEANTLARMLPPTLNDIIGADEGSHTPLTQHEPGLADVRTKIQINKAFAPMAFRKSIERGTSLLNGTVNSQFMSALATVVNSTPLRENIGKVPAWNIDDLNFNAPFYRELEPTQTFQPPRAAVVGVMVEKTRIHNGKKYQMPTIVVAEPNATIALDTQVAYGQTYEYVARTLSLFKVLVTDGEGRMYIATYLIASQPTQPVQVSAIETRAPRPPSDISFYYNYGSGGLNIFWRPPVNPQRDVKYYQVFRRKDLDHPFELIHMVDFDDSLIRSKPIEEVDPSLIRAYRFPTLQYCDKEFTKSSSFIYAVVSVDARMQSSTYSAQMLVSFDQHENNIKLKIACGQGAPKQYPNWTKEESFFVDSIKDSGHDNVKIYFDPEVYNFIDDKGIKHPLFLGNNEDRMAKYVFQFINTDRLSEQRFEIKIDNTAIQEMDLESKINSVSTTSVLPNPAVQETVRNLIATGFYGVSLDD